MKIYKEIILNAKTGKETKIDFTDKERVEFEAKQEQAATELVFQEQAEAEKQSLRDSAYEKLAAVGLSPEEIAAITG